MVIINVERRNIDVTWEPVEAKSRPLSYLLNYVSRLSVRWHLDVAVHATFHREFVSPTLF